MRKSKAPSHLHKAAFKSPIISSKSEIGVSFKEKSLVNTVNETSTSSENIKTAGELSSPGELNETIRHFLVVYGKRSTKKHKTWEGDGSLIVSAKSATLKDENGKVIGQITNLKTQDLEEGSRLFIGGKEVEIIESVTSVAPVKKRPIGKENDDINQQDLKKKKISMTSISELTATTLSKSKLHSKFDELILPRPTDEHQWLYNVDCLPITPVSVPSNLCRILRPHQREGIIFLYKCISGIRNVDYNGAILADEMGLGKTLQCISLIWTLLNFGPYGGKPFLKRVLIVVPSSLTQNWNNEFIRWIGSHKIRVFVVDKKKRPSDYLQAQSPVLIISYEMFMRSYEEIKDVQFDMIVCDEGHRLKNCNIRTTTLLNSLSCKKRILLTGTPIQNDLQEFFALVDLVNHGILGNSQDFRKQYIEPIVASREPNAPKEVIKIGETKGEELNRLTSSFILRRTQAVIGKFLPQKNDYVVFCEPTELQKTIYSAATNYWLEQFENKTRNQEYSEHLSVIHSLKKICNHPVLVKRSVNNHEPLEENLSTRINLLLSKYHWSSDLTENSGKLAVVNDMLKVLSKTKERIVLVSNFTQTLDLFEQLCNQCGYKYLRFDGSTPTSARQDIVNRFNGAHSDIYILLLSSKAGGVGLNLTGGSRLILYDSDWNPATDLQAMARIWREGQKKSVHIYRLLTSGTIEEKIFQRQLTKAGLSESIVDPNSTSNVKLSFEELKDLFNFTGNDKCLTHEILRCGCSGDGGIPESFMSDVTEDREAELMPENTSALTNLRMNQLFHWEHHVKPVAPHILQEMGVLDATEKINYVFKNKTQ